MLLHGIFLNEAILGPLGARAHERSDATLEAVPYRAVEASWMPPHGSFGAYLEVQGT